MGGICQNGNEAALITGLLPLSKSILVYTWQAFLASHRPAVGGGGRGLSPMSRTGNNNEVQCL